MDTSEAYRLFADQTRNVSPCLEAWSLGVAEDAEVITLIDTLPDAKRQPNLVFAAARRAGADAGPYTGLRDVLLSRWEDVRATALTHSTQTNEAGRCASLLPVLAALPEPLALLEVGASAGLCLYPDRYSYRYGDRASLDPPVGAGTVVLAADLLAAAPIPSRLPEVVWRAGLDLNPLDVRDDEQMAWLELLVWPEHDHRRRRLRGAIDVARADPPRLVQGDLNEGLVRLAAEAPSDATLVVFHSAVLAYLSAAERERFVGVVTDLPGHWISNEGPRVLPEVTSTASRPTTYDGEVFVLGLDGRAQAWTGPHGQVLDWL